MKPKLKKNSSAAKITSSLALNLIPSAYYIFEKLNEFVIGQEKAKKAVALAFVNNLRRCALEETNKELAEAIIPKNVLLSGPTGVGKTEIARTLAKLEDSPFIKVEVTKFTEVGYAGKDTESIISDLFYHAIKEERKKQTIIHGAKAKEEAKNKVSKIVLKQHEVIFKDETIADLVSKINKEDQEFLSYEIEIENDNDRIFEIFDGSSFEDVKMEGGSTNFNVIPLIGSIDFSPVKKKKKVSIKEALKIFEKKEINKKIKEEDIISVAREKVEKRGIVFLDEIDKIITNKENSGRGEVSREGVQRDLLSIVEGTTVNTSFGSIKTDHILFIASGAFHSSTPDDLMDEMKGRFPIRATLEPLTAKDYCKILRNKKNNLIDQYKGLLKCSNIDLSFTEEAINEIGKITEDLNTNLGNLGARRLFSIMESIMEEISFDKEPKSSYEIDVKFIKEIYKKLNSTDLNMGKFII